MPPERSVLLCAGGLPWHSGCALIRCQVPCHHTTAVQPGRCMWTSSPSWSCSCGARWATCGNQSEFGEQARDVPGGTKAHDARTTSSSSSGSVRSSTGPSSSAAPNGCTLPRYVRHRWATDVVGVHRERPSLAAILPHTPFPLCPLRCILLATCSRAPLEKASCATIRIADWSGAVRRSAVGDHMRRRALADAIRSGGKEAT